MASAHLALTRYAKALYELAAAAGETERVGGDLADLESLIAENDELRQQLASPRVTADAKKKVLLDLLGQVGSDLVRRTVLLLTDKGRGGSVGGLAAAWREVSMDAENRAVAQVTSAVALGDADREQLLAQLTKLTGKTVTLEESVDTDLLGGVRIRLGSRMIDGSLRRRLEELGDRLMSAPLGSSG